MSFYWQQAVASDSQQPGQESSQQQQSAWDIISLATQAQTPQVYQQWQQGTHAQVQNNVSSYNAHADPQLAYQENYQNGMANDAAQYQQQHQHYYTQHPPQQATHDLPQSTVEHAPILPKKEVNEVLSAETLSHTQYQPSFEHPQSNWDNHVEQPSQQAYNPVEAAQNDNVSVAHNQEHGSHVAFQSSVAIPEPQMLNHVSGVEKPVPMTMDGQTYTGSSTSPPLQSVVNGDYSLQNKEEYFDQCRTSVVLPNKQNVSSDHNLIAEDTTEKALSIASDGSSTNNWHVYGQEAKQVPHFEHQSAQRRESETSREHSAETTEQTAREQHAFEENLTKTPDHPPNESPDAITPMGETITSNGPLTSTPKEQFTPDNFEVANNTRRRGSHSSITSERSQRSVHSARAATDKHYSKSLSSAVDPNIEGHSSQHHVHHNARDTQVLNPLFSNHDNDVFDEQRVHKYAEPPRLPENEVSDSASSTVPSSRDQIVQQYLEFRKRFPTMLNRIGRTSAQGMPRSITNPLFEEGRRSALGRSSVASARRPSSTQPKHNVTDKRVDQSSVTNPDVSMEMSFESTQTGYGDGFVENSRRSRLHRERPESRSGHALANSNQEVSEYDLRHTNFKHAPSGRRSAVGYSERHSESTNADYSQQKRRPQSSYDHRAMQRMEHSGLAMDQYDVYNSPGISSASNDDDCSDAEMAQYTSHTAYFTQTEVYLIGSLRVPLSKFVAAVRKFPPPPQFHSMGPHEKVAYVFFTALWQHNYSDISAFHKKFNREFYILTAAGVDDEEALYQICANLQSKHTEIRKQKYTNTQKQLFSDERDSHDDEDRISDRASVYDGVDGNDDADPSQKAPLKFRTPHAFVSFGACGRMIILNPEFSMSALQVTDIRSLLSDDKSRRLIDAVSIFRGPLLENTPPHSVTLYIRRQMDRIMSSEVARENEQDNDVIDCLLIWQLLLMLVQQHGKVTGPDIARLLIDASRKNGRRDPKASRESSATPVTMAQHDPRARELFTQFLLEGHIDEAIDLSLRHGLFADAMILASRVEPSKLSKIEEHFIGAMSMQNPVTTLMAVASKQAAPILLNPPTEDGSWREHAAIVLANLNSWEAMNTVYSLGRVLAQKEYHAAADFCMLAVALLTTINPFQRPERSADSDATVREHISLIHASLPDDESESTICKYGFSLTDLHATEIFAYGVSLVNPSASGPLSTSVEYQCHRIQYARLLGDLGFPQGAYGYCVDIARQIWEFHNALPQSDLHSLCDIAEQVQVQAEADPSSTGWIQDLRRSAEGRAAVTQTTQEQNIGPTSALPHEEVQESQADAHSHVNRVEETAQSFFHEHVPSSPNREPMQPPVQTENFVEEAAHLPPQSVEEHHVHHSNTVAVMEGTSIASQAADWHGGHQTPLQFKGPEEHKVNQNGPVMPQAAPQFTEDAGPPPMQIPQVPSIDNVPHHNLSSEQPPFPSEPSSVASAQYQTPYPEPVTPSPPAQIPPDPIYQSAPQLEHLVSRPAPTQEPPSQTSPSMNNAGEKPPNEMKKSASSSSSKGLFGRLKDQIVKAIPSTNEMILPDDSQKKIVWDPVKGRYIGEGVEEESVAAPPPALGMPTMNGPAQGSAGSPPPSGISGGLKAARVSGGSRYFNPLNAASKSTPSQVQAPVPNMTIPTTFGFIPTAPETDDATESPFSESTHPHEEASDPSHQQQ